MEFSIKDGVVHLYNIENDLDTIRHSIKRLKFLLPLSTTEGIALQTGGFITIMLHDHTISSMEIEDKSYKIYPVILGDNFTEQIEETFELINEYCKNQIKFLTEYSLPIFSDDINVLFNSIIEAIINQKVNKTKKLLKILELHILRKHIQDIIVSKTYSKEETETAFKKKLNTYIING